MKAFFFVCLVLAHAGRIFFISLLIEIYFWKNLQKVVDAAVHWAIVFLWCCGIIDGSPILFFCDLFQDCSNRRGLFCLSNFEALQFFRWSGRVKCLVNFLLLFDSSSSIVCWLPLDFCLVLNCPVILLR